MNEKSEQNRMDMSEHTFSQSDFEYSINRQYILTGLISYFDS